MEFAAIGQVRSSYRAYWLCLDDGVLCPIDISISCDDLNYHYYALKLSEHKMFLKTLSYFVMILMICSCDNRFLDRGLKVENAGANKDQSNAIPSSHSNAQEEEPKARLSFANKNVLTCVPGCRLDADSENKPIVPNWCVTWQPESPACNRTADGQISCRGSWAGVDRRLYGFSKNRDTRFHLPEYKSELPRNRNKTSSDFVWSQWQIENVST